MDTVINVLLQAAQGHPLEVAGVVFLCLGFFGVAVLWKLFEIIKTFATKKDITDLEVLNAAQHRQLTEGFSDILNDLKESFKLNDLKLKETVGGFYDRINPMDQRLSKLEGEHEAIAGSGHCATVRHPGEHPHV